MHEALLPAEKLLRYLSAQADASCRVGFVSVPIGFLPPFFVFCNLLEKCRAHIAPCVARDTSLARTYLPRPTNPTPKPLSHVPYPTSSTFHALRPYEQCGPR